MLDLKGLLMHVATYIQTRAYEDRKREHGSMIEHYSKRDRYEFVPGDPRATS